MAAQEELQILLKAVGAKDTEAALKNISGLLRKAGEDAKSVGPGAKVASAALGELESKGRDLAGSLGPAGSLLTSLGPAGLAAAAGIGATVGATILAANTLRDWTQSMLDTAGALTDQRDETDISLKALQEYSYVAAAAGTTQQQLVDSLQRASRVIVEGGEATEKAAARLGLPFEKLRAMNPDQQLMAIRTALDGVATSAEKAAILKDLGFSDPAILRVMAQDVAGLRAEFQKLGLGLKDEVLERFDAMGDELGKLGVATDSFKRSIVLAALGNADAGQTIKDLTALVAEAGAAARDAAPLFSDLFTVITGAPLTAQIERLRFLIAALRSVVGFVKSGGKEIAFELPKAQEGSGLRQNVPKAPPSGLPPGDAAQQRLKAAQEAFKALRDTITGGSIEAERALAQLAAGGMTTLGAAFAGIEADTRAKLAGVQKAVEDAVAKGVSREKAQAAVAPLISAYKEVGEAAKRAAEEAARKSLLGQTFGDAALQAASLLEITERFGDRVNTLTDSDLQGLVGKLFEAQRAFAAVGDDEGVAKAQDQIEKAAAAVVARAKEQNDYVAVGNGLWERRRVVVEESAQADADASRKSAESAEERAAALEREVAQWQELVGLFGGLGQIFDDFGLGFLSNVVGAFQKGAQAALDFKTATTNAQKAVAVGQAAGAAYSSGSALGGAATGAAFGAQFGPIGAAIGGVAGGILGFFGGKARIRKELAELRAQLLQSVGGSMDELRKKAASLGVDISRAFTTKDPKELKRIMEELNKAAEEQKKRWEGVQTAVAGLTQRVKGFATELSKSLRLSENVSFADTFNTIREKIDSGTLSLDVMTEATERQKAEFDRLGLFAVATFASYIRESGDVIGALKEMESSLADLSLAQELFGFEGSKAFNQLLQLRGVVAANADVADSIQGLNQLMQGLGDAGLNSKELFDAFGQDAVELFTQLTAGGASANQAMALMQPTLQKLWEHQKRYGDITDEATLKLLAEAEAQGIVGEAMQSVNQQILDVLIAIGDVLGAQIPAGLKRMGDAAEREFGRFGNSAGRAGNQIPTNFPGGATGGASTGGPSGVNPDEGGFAIGGTIDAPLSGRKVTATFHGLEHIIPDAKLASLVSAAVERGYQAAVAQFAGMQAGGGGGDVYLDNEKVGRIRRRDLETGRGLPRRGPMAPRRR